MFSRLNGSPMDRAPGGALGRNLRRTDSVWLVAMLAAAGAGCFSGCGREQESAKRFDPPVDLARAAVAAVLADWQAGEERTIVGAGLPVAVHVVDKQRQRNQVLEDYEILGEAPGDTARCFAVRLKLRHPDADEKVRFVVIGIDPLWVFRHEDFESLTQWTCGKADDEPEESPAESSRSAIDDGQPRSGSGDSDGEDAVSANAASPAAVDAAEDQKQEETADDR